MCVPVLVPASAGEYRFHQMSEPLEGQTQYIQPYLTGESGPDEPERIAGPRGAGGGDGRARRAGGRPGGRAGARHGHLCTMQHWDTIHDARLGDRETVLTADRVAADPRPARRRAAGHAGL